MRWLFLLAITMLLSVAPAQPAQAQEAPPALVVRLRDVTGASVAGAEVIITDDSGATVLARATSDATGIVAIGPLPVAEVRVVVQGHLADGTLLLLSGADEQGISIVLGAAPVTLELRSEADGTVLPDPSTELTLEPGVEVPLITVDPAQLPPAPPASAALAATVVVFPTASAASVTIVDSPAVLVEADTLRDQHAAPPLWPGLLLLGALLLALTAVVVVQLGWGKQ